MTNDRGDKAMAKAIAEGRIIPYTVDEEYPRPVAMPGPGALTQAEIDEIWRERENEH